MIFFIRSSEDGLYYLLPEATQKEKQLYGIVGVIVALIKLLKPEI
jgi:hypothetical protein